MASGKTSAGLLLADRIGWTFIDTDSMIEKMYGRTVSDIFAASGEEVFRRYEKQVLREIARGSRQVVATGGGIVLDPGNRRLMRNRGLIIWLKVDAADVLKRIKGDRSRPLLMTGNPEQRVADLMNQREGLYAEADVIVGTRGLTVEQVAQVVWEALCWFQEGDLCRENGSDCCTGRI